MRFGAFEIDSAGQRLLRDGQEVRLERRAQQFLQYLAARPGTLVTKDTLLRDVWQAKTLSDGVLSNTVAKVRKALGQSARASRPIETVHGAGYRFVPDAPAPHPSARSGPPAPQRSTEAEITEFPFVGREAILSMLQAQVNAVAQGHSAFVILQGEAGIGKSHTARELAQRAEQEGFLVLAGLAHDDNGAPAYWPWSAIFRDAASHLGLPRLLSCLPANATMLSKWAAEPCTPEPSPNPAAEQPRPAADAARFQLFDEWSRLASNLAQIQPTLIWLDDLHWADQGTVQLLAHMARATEGCRLLLLAALRPTPAGPPESTGADLRKLLRYANFITLDGLSAEEVGRLATALTGVADDPELRAALHARSGGNPFIIQQLLQLATQQRTADNARALAALLPPPPVRDLLSQRLRPLTPQLRQLLSVAALLGQTFNAERLGWVMDMPPDQVLEQLQPALDCAVIQGVETAPYTFTFAHTLMRDALRTPLSVAAKGRWHRRIGDILARLPTQGDPYLLAELAYHQTLALPPDIEAVLSTSHRAAAAARQSGGFEAAAEIGKRALSMLSHTALDPGRRGALLLATGEDLFCVGQLKAARGYFQSAATLALDNSALELLAEANFRLSDCLQFGVGDDALVRRMLHDTLAQIARQLADSSTQPPRPLQGLRARVLAHIAETSIGSASAERIALLDQAEAIAATIEDATVRLEVAHSRAVLRDPTRLAENLAAVDAFFALQRGNPAASAGLRNQLLRRFDAHVTRYAAYLTRCDQPNATKALTACEELAAQSAVPALKVVIGLIHAGRALYAQQIDVLQHLVDRLEKAAGATDLAHLAWLNYLVELHRLQGEGHLLAADESRWTEALRDISTPYRSIGLIKRLTLHVSLGQRDRARELLTHVPAQHWKRMPVNFGDLGLLCQLADASIALQDRERATALRQQLEPFARLNAVGPAFEYTGAVAQTLGALARFLGDLVQAERYFSQAKELNSQIAP